MIWDMDISETIYVTSKVVHGLKIIRGTFISN